MYVPLKKYATEEGELPSTKDNFCFIFTQKVWLPTCSLTDLLLDRTSRLSIILSNGLQRHLVTKKKDGIICEMNFCFIFTQKVWLPTCSLTDLLLYSTSRLPIILNNGLQRHLVTKKKKRWNNMWNEFSLQRVTILCYTDQSNGK